MADRLKLFFLRHCILFYYSRFSFFCMLVCFEICVQFGTHTRLHKNCIYLTNKYLKILSTQAIDTEKIDIATHTHTHQYILHAQTRIHMVLILFSFIDFMLVLCKLK